MEYILSIVIPTLGRTKEVESLISSIYKYEINEKYSIEILIVDQNFSDILDSIVFKFSSNQYPISHFKVSFRGLSKAKNFGAKQAKGKYICFVDDDAEFLSDTINRALEILEEGKFDIVSGRCVDRDGKNSVIKFSIQQSLLTLSDFEGKFIESAMFFKKNIFDSFQYDENLGVGAFYGAEEGYDIVYRLLLNNTRILFDPNLKFYHPQTVDSHSSPSAIRRVFTYRLGYGYLCKKHKFVKKYWMRLFAVSLYIPYLLIFRRNYTKYYLAELLGLLSGKIL